MITIDTGVNGAMAIWTNGQGLSVIEWGRSGRTNGKHMVYICELIESHTEKSIIGTVVVERPFIRQPKGGAFQYLLFEDIKSMCDRRKVAFRYLTPPSIKAKVGGGMKCSKEDMKTGVLKYCSERDIVFSPPTTEHGWDAISVGIAYNKRRPQ